MNLRKIEKLINDHLAVLNQMDSHLGCAKCSGPLELHRGRNFCPSCQPSFRAIMETKRIRA